MFPFVYVYIKSWPTGEVVAIVHHTAVNKKGEKNKRKEGEKNADTELTLEDFSLTAREFLMSEKIFKRYICFLTMRM